MRGRKSSQRLFYFSGGSPSAAGRHHMADLPRKTRVRGFRRHASGQTSSRRRGRSMFTPGSRGCAYKTVSGRPEWPTKDPNEETGGLNLYTFVGNNSVGKIDDVGRSEISIPFFGPVEIPFPGLPSFPFPRPSPRPIEPPSLSVVWNPWRDSSFSITLCFQNLQSGDMDDVVNTMYNDFEKV